MTATLQLTTDGTLMIQSDRPEISDHLWLQRARLCQLHDAKRLLIRTVLETGHPPVETSWNPETF